jgi:hypothetical protein
MILIGFLRVPPSSEQADVVEGGSEITSRRHQIDEIDQLELETSGCLPIKIQLILEHYTSPIRERKGTPVLPARNLDLKI